MTQQIESLVSANIEPGNQHCRITVIIAHSDVNQGSKPPRADSKHSDRTFRISRSSLGLSE